jgi:hypothetical protein
MDCPNCGTWNPDDKDVCWRCQTKLPSPPPKKTKRQSPMFLGLPLWAWVAMILFILISTLGQCAFLPPVA